MRCAGSSLFLKNKFGVGYHLRIDLEKTHHKDQIKKTVRDYISESKLDRQTNSELIFTLPSNQSYAFPGLFKWLDNSNEKAALGIKGFGVTLTTLEDVFFEINKCAFSANEGHEPVKVEIPSMSRINFVPIFAYKCWYFGKIRFLIMLRNWWFLLTVSTFFVSQMLLCYFFVAMFRDHRISTPIQLSSSLYPIRNMLFTSTSNRSDLLEAISSSCKLNPVQIPEFNLQTSQFNIYGIEVEGVRIKSIIFNKTYHHALPILQNVLTNGFVSVFLKKQFKINVSSDALPNMNANEMSSPIFILSLSLVLTLIPVFIALEIIDDRHVSNIEFHSSILIV